MDNINNLKEHVQSLTEKAAKTGKLAESRLQTCPTDEIYTCMLQGRRRYFSRKPVTDGKRTYIDGKHTEDIAKLEEAHYLRKLLKASEQEQQTLAKVVKLLNKCPDVSTVFLKIEAYKRHLIKPLETEYDEKRIKMFTKYKSPGRVDSSSYKTMNGELVRSKSELIIADRLKSKDVPYDYESGTLMDETVEIWHPDFAVLNRRTGKVYYWEHFGMLDKGEYCNSFQYKLERFAQKGIFPGENLIITTETSEHPLNTEYVDMLIDHYLL